MTKGADPRDDDRCLSAALMDIAALLDRVDGDAGWLSALRFGVAGGLAAYGEAALAEAGFRAILAREPRQMWCWIGLIDLAMARGDAAAGAAIGRDATLHLPDAAELRRKTAEAVQHSEGAQAALDVMLRGAIPDLSASDLVYVVDLFRQTGDVSDAGAVCDRLLALRHDDALAHLARIEIGLQAGNGPAAAASAEAALAHHPTHPEIVLRAAQAHRLAEDPARALRLIATAPGDTAFAPDFARLRAEIAEQMLDAATPVDFPHEPEVPEPDEGTEAEPFAPPEGVFAALEAEIAANALAADQVADRMAGVPDLPWYLALRLVERAWSAGRKDLAARLADVLGSGDWPAADRQAFQIEDRLQRDGPRAALDWIRANPAPRRDVEAAERLGRVLLGAGAGPLAARYLTACCRRWPEDAVFLRMATEALIGCGAAARVTDLVQRAGPGVGQGLRLACRVAAAQADGPLAPALAACDSALAAGQGPLPYTDIMDLRLLSGDLAGAEMCLTHISVEDGPLEEALICRPRASRLGTLLNEARILAAWDAEGAGEADQTAGADIFMVRAADAVRTARTGAAGVVRRSGVAVPDEIHVVWSFAQAMPAEIERIIAAWRGATRRKLTVHDARDTPTWLRETIGKDAERAWRAARQVEEKTDLMRLATLMVSGGVAIALDQWPGGDVDGFFDGMAGPTFFADGTGIILTDCMVAPPNDRVVAAAFDMAAEACLAREGLHPWFKTGPGTITRALAAHLRDMTDEVTAPDLRGQGELRRVIHPHRGMDPAQMGLLRR